MIIESGLDIPNANTIIINRADRFGLAQLYQLRGRVGRSNHRAYAYLLVPRDKALSGIARKRLGAIEEFTELASGYKLAMRDLEIRGAGNILGAEQHGHMLAIGFNLYGRLLREAVKELRGEVVAEEPEATVNIKVDAYIPDRYIADNDMKIDIYKRIRDAGTEGALLALEEELVDRFGAPPGEVGALLDVQAVRLLCRAAGVREIGLSGGVVEAVFASGREPKPGALREILGACDVPLEFDARRGLALRFRAPRDKREALRVGRKVLKHFAGCASLPK
jgi:transcription-repair coupling factor (superfamily II helicase)